MTTIARSLTARCTIAFRRMPGPGLIELIEEVSRSDWNAMVPESPVFGALKYFLAVALKALNFLLPNILYVDV